MEDPKPKNNYEFYFESAILVALSIICITLIVIGGVACTAVHPCAVWSAILMVVGGAFLSVPANILVALLILPKIVEQYRKTPSQSDED